ncbi:MAG: hypothetical protein PHS61_05110 [Candidatus Omnitrophica bacterium]|nr:hypothetical protein [Candidatus Omnitrophota bacterium]
MMRKILIWCLVLAGGFMTGCSPKMRYEIYRAKDPELNIVVEYPAGWIVQEHKDPKAGYVNVLFIENNPRKSFRPVIGIMAKKASSLKDPAWTPQAFSRAIVRTRLKLSPAKVLSERAVMIAGVPANQTVVSFHAQEKLYTPDARSIAVKEKMAVFKRDDVFYVLRFEAGPEDYPLYEKAYRRAAKTLQMIR